MEKRSGSKSREKKNRAGNNILKLSLREKTFAIIVLAAVLVGAWLPGRLIISTSPSLDHRIFFLTRAKDTIKTGDYLVFRHKETRFVHKGLDQKNDRLVKKVGCCPGDILSIDTERTFFCGQIEMGKALEADSQDRSLPVLEFTGPVPENSYFMVGTNPRSFDSKYFGFVHADNIFYKALPLW